MGLITYPFLNFSGATVDVWEGMNNFIEHFTRKGAYLSMLKLKLKDVSKRDPGPQVIAWLPDW